MSDPQVDVVALKTQLYKDVSECGYYRLLVRIARIHGPNTPEYEYLARLLDEVLAGDIIPTQ